MRLSVVLGADLGTEHVCRFSCVLNAFQENCREHHCHTQELIDGTPLYCSTSAEYVVKRHGVPAARRLQQNASWSILLRTQCLSLKCKKR
jgi:hypothetical protein